MPVVAPFPYIAMHIVQSPGVRFLPAYRVCGVSTVSLIPPCPGTVVLSVARVIFRGGPGPASILPLRLGRQAVAVPGEIALPGVRVV